jgi:hypothetical protein
MAASAGSRGAWWLVQALSLACVTSCSADQRGETQHLEGGFFIGPAAEALVLEQHPGGRVHAVDSSLVSEENRVRMLAAWVRQQGQ